MRSFGTFVDATALTLTTGTLGGRVSGTCADVMAEPAASTTKASKVDCFMTNS
jgi:hypothetical protein